MNIGKKVNYYKRKLKEDPSNPEILFNLARACFDANLIEDALNFYRKAIEIDFHMTKAYIELANLLFSIDKIDKAIEVCQLGIDYNPESSSLFYLMEQLYEMVGEYELANQTLEDLINIDSGYTKAYEALGRLAILQNRLVEARIWLEKLIDIDPKYITGYIYLSNIHRRNGEFDKAIDYLNTAKEYEPENLDIYNDMGLIYLEMGDYERAQEQLEYVVTKDPEYSFALDNLGIIYRKQKKYIKAEEYLKKSLSQNLQAWTYNELALVYTELGRYKDSIDCSKKSLAIDKDYVYAYDNLAANYRRLGYYDEAEDALKNSIKFKPDDSWTYNQLGLLYYERGMYTSAKTNFVRSFELDQDHIWPKINLASCYIKEKKYDLATNYLNELQKKYTDNVRVFLLSSKVYTSLGNFDKALKMGKTALQVDPKDPLAISNIAIIYRNQEDYDKAEEYFIKAIDSPKLKDSSVYLEYAIKNILTNNYNESFNCCIKAMELDELNSNIYCLMAIIENSASMDSHFFKYIKAVEEKFNDRKEVFLSQANSYIELGLPEEAEKYFNIALRAPGINNESLYGLSQTYYLMNLFDKSMENAFYNTDNSENIEIASYSNALVALNYRKINNEDKFNHYKSEALALNPTIKSEFYQKFKIRENLKYKARKSFFEEIYNIF